MALIKDSSVEQVRDAADMVEIVGAHTQLRRVGSRWVGRCPFHEERTPSFSVNAERKLYHCFGCGVGGDLIGFVREMESLDFVQAVELLAERTRVPLEYEEVSPQAEERRARRDRLFDLLESAAKFFERNLWEAPAAKRVRAYLEERDLNVEACRAFRLGFSPGGSVLASKARERGYTRDELTAGGLINRRGNDYFGERLIFPLADARGRVRGFGARELPWVEYSINAKYVNSPEGELFNKTQIVYGLDRARSSVAKDDRAIVVEGYTDVIALHEAGLPTAVAAMGTALTTQQLRELRRVASRLVLCFDSDLAGQEATLRGMELAVGEGFDVKVVALPAGQDPADAPEEFAARLEEPSSYLVYRTRLELDRAPNRQEGFERVRQILSNASDSPDRLDAMRIAADRLELPRETQAALAPRARREGVGAAQRVIETADRLERDALAGCIAHPDLVANLAELSEEVFDDPGLRALRNHLVDGSVPAESVTGVLAELDARAAREAIDETTTRQLLLQLEARTLRRRLDRAVEEEAAETASELRSSLGEVRDAIRALG
jgi:DNA primase